MLALVFSKLDPETLLRVGHLPESGHWNYKLTLAKSADPYGRDRAGRDHTQPFGHSKMTRRHTEVSQAEVCVIGTDSAYAAQQRSRTLRGTFGRWTGVLQLG